MLNKAKEYVAPKLIWFENQYSIFRILPRLDDPQAVATKQANVIEIIPLETKIDILKI